MCAVVCGCGCCSLAVVVIVGCCWLWWLLLVVVAKLCIRAEGGSLNRKNGDEPGGRPDGPVQARGRAVHHPRGRALRRSLWECPVAAHAQRRKHSESTRGRPLGEVAHNSGAEARDPHNVRHGDVCGMVEVGLLSKRALRSLLHAAQRAQVLGLGSPLQGSQATQPRLSTQRWCQRP